MQVHTAHSDARLQLLDSPDCALRTDRRPPALAPPVHRGHEPYSLAATPLPVWLPQQCPHDRPQPSLLRGPGRLAVIAGMLTSLLSCILFLHVMPVICCCSHVGVLTSFFRWMLFLCEVHVICCCSMSISVPLHLKLHAGAQRQHIPDRSVDPEMSAQPGDCYVESFHQRYV